MRAIECGLPPSRSIMSCQVREVMQEDERWVALAGFGDL